MELLLRQGTNGTHGNEDVTLESLCHHRRHGGARLPVKGGIKSGGE